MSKVFTSLCRHLGKCKRLCKMAAGVGLLLAAAATSALPEDREQPIHIESNRAERQERTGLTIYEGDVVITQGSIRVEADKVVVYTENHQAVRIEATGNPARYRQILEHGDPPVHARSQLIDYRVQEDMLILSRDAHLEQEGSTITGERIEYDLVQEIIRAQGDLEGRQRIHMVIPPGGSQRNGSGEAPEAAGDAALAPEDTDNDGN